MILQNKTRQLADIESFFTTNQSRSPDGRSTVGMYTDTRGAYIAGSLQNLASASISTSRKKSPNEIYRQGTSGIGHYGRGLKGMFLAEWRIITSVFPRDSWSYVFENTTRSALAEFSRTLRELSTQIRANMTTDCFLAYEIVGIVNRLAIDIDGDTGQLKQQLVDAVKPVRDTAKVSIGELLDDIRRRISVMIAFPSDGASLPLTADIMTRLQTLVLYSQPLASILTSLGDGNWYSRSNNGSSTSLPSTKSFDVGADGNQLLAHYVLDSIEALLSNLESRGKVLTKSKAVFGIFLANNVAVVDRMVRSSDLQGLLTSTNSSNKMDSWRKKGTATYLDAWREPCAALMDVQYTNRGARPPSGQGGYIDSATIIKGLSSKDKDAIKEKFKSFNISFEGLSAKHKEMSGSMEREVRSQLDRDIQAMIEPLYARFWDRYHDVDRGRGKYVRYDKESLSAALASLG
jgi:exocyst complex protein 7